MRIAIVDDLYIERTKLNSYITQYFNSIDHPPLFSIRDFSSGDMFLEEFSINQFDVIFLDILMDGKNGIETAKIIRSMDKDVKLIFTTSDNSFACESYEVDALYYCLKPYTYERLSFILDKIKIRNIELQQYVIMPNGVKIVLRNIEYSEHINRSVLLYLKIGENKSFSITQKQMEEILLPFPYFANSMKGLIVNLFEVEHMENTCFVLKSGKIVPISRRNYSKMKEAYANHIFQTLRKGATYV